MVSLVKIVSWYLGMFLERDGSFVISESVTFYGTLLACSNSEKSFSVTRASVAAKQIVERKNVLKVIGAQ